MKYSRICAFDPHGHRPSSGTLLADPNQSKRSPGDRSETRDHVEVDPHIAEPVIGRAFARPVGSSGLQLRSLCALVGTLRCPPCQLRCANCFASRASAVSIGELRQINPTGKSLKVCPALRAKIFRLTRRANQCSFYARLTADEGRVAIVTNVRWDAVDARVRSRRTRLMRTAKSCGPDAAVLASSS